MKGNTIRRDDSIDALRALFIMAVMLFHYLVRWNLPLYPENIMKLDHVYSYQWTLGAFGVQLFFIISGIVIPLTLLRSSSAWDFLLKRLSRLVPVYIACILITFAIARAYAPALLTPAYADVLSSIFFLPSVMPEGSPFRYVDGVYWSLAVEFKFYFLCAFLFLILRKRFWIGVIGTSLAAIAMSHIHVGIADKLLIYKHLPFFLIGIGLYYLKYENDVRTAAWNGGAGLVGYALVLSAVGAGELVSSAYPYVLSAGIVLTAACVLYGSRLPVYYLAEIGRRSYSIYLLHQIIGIILIRFFKESGMSDWLSIALAFAIIFALADLVYRLLEIPLQRQVRKFLHVSNAKGA